MSIGQQIYFAVELFAPEKKTRTHFCSQITQTLTRYGSAQQVASQVASVLADALSQPCADYHLAMAHLISFHPPLESAIDGDQPAEQALHYYMRYFLDLLDLTDVRRDQEPRYAIN